MVEINDLDKRLAIVEIEFKNLKENLRGELDEVKETSKETFDLLIVLKERMDKQNGLLPHMSDSMTELSQRVDCLNNNFGTYIASKKPAVASKASKSPVAIAAKWTAIGVIVAASIAALVEVVRTFVLS